MNSSFQFNYQEALELKTNRQKINLPLDNIILELQSKGVNSDFLKFCFLNRDYISYSLLYQLTALKLKGEEAESDVLRVDKIKELRKNILENIQLIDQPITQSLIVSEKIVKEILLQDNLESNLDFLIKKNKIDVSSLWIVLTAAISAWQNKIKFEEDEISKKTLEKLKLIKKKIFSDKRNITFLAKEFKLLDSLNSTTALSSVEIGLLDGIKLLICILEKLPKSSYGILLNEVSITHKNLMLSSLGLKEKPMVENGIQFLPKKIVTDSRLVNIKK